MPGWSSASRASATILAALEHPHIARLYDAGVDAVRAALAGLEYVDGERIDRWCDAHDLAVPIALRAVSAGGEAVAHAHARLIVHRDLKPSNVLVDRRRRRCACSTSASPS